MFRKLVGWYAAALRALLAVAVGILIFLIIVLVEVLDQRVDDFVRHQRLARGVGGGLVPVHR